MADARNWLQQYRTERKETQRQAAKEMRISQSSYALIENGQRNPSVKMAQKIGEHFGFPWTRFFPDTAPAQMQQEGVSA